MKETPEQRLNEVWDLIMRALRLVLRARQLRRLRRSEISEAADLLKLAADRLLSLSHVREDE